MTMIYISLNQNEEPYPMSIERFEELFSLKYCHQLEFSDWKTEQWLRQHCAAAQKKGRIGQLALWLGKLHEKQIEEAPLSDFSIRWIGPQIGYGTFTRKPLKKWGFIGEYTGLLRRRNLFFPNINDYCFMYPRAWLAFKAFTIDSERYGNFTRFINHSDCPNCESVSVFQNGIFHIIFRAIQEIPAGEELTYDYGNIYWNRRKKLPEQPVEELIAPEDLKKLV
jgi:uncharacterized protein